MTNDCHHCVLPTKWHRHAHGDTILSHADSGGVQPGQRPAWQILPPHYPSYQTCHRRFQQWQREGTLTRVLCRLAEDLRDRGKIDLSETFIDASFSAAKKGALLSAPLAAAKAAKSWRSQTAMVFLSPAASPALRRMKRNSSKTRSSGASREPSQSG